MKLKHNHFVVFKAKVQQQQKKYKQAWVYFLSKQKASSGNIIASKTIAQRTTIPGLELVPTNSKLGLDCAKRGSHFGSECNEACLRYLERLTHVQWKVVGAKCRRC